MEVVVRRAWGLHLHQISVVISTDDVWVVGDRLSGGESSKVHWEGSTWTEIGESEFDTHLYDVDADSPARAQ